MDRFLPPDAPPEADPTRPEGEPRLRHFTLSEFACPCCGRADMDPVFLSFLDAAREYAGIPFWITSGYRCVKHNIEVGGVVNSAHLAGKAADIACSDSRTRYHIVNACLTAGFTRFELGPRHVHVDKDGRKLPWVIDLAASHTQGGK